jgi:uncharacterized sporulation protein YeaH/YhbH (DUF444 family)
VRKDHQEITTTYTFDEVRRKGAMATLDKKRTLLENLTRHAADKQPNVGAFRDKEYHSNAAVYLRFQEQPPENVR